MEEFKPVAAAFDEHGFAILSAKDNPAAVVDDDESNRCHLYSPQPSESVVKAWEKVCEGWASQSTASPWKLRQLLKKGVPRDMRGRVWSLFLNSNSFKAQSSFDYQASLDKLQSRLKSHDLTDQSSDKNVRHINILIDQLSSVQCEGGVAGARCEGGEVGVAGAQCEGGEASDFLTWARAIRQIMMDIIRTFPTHQLFIGDTSARRSLLRVLTVYAQYNPAVGYCQGMAYVAALLLMNMDEEDAFWAMMSLFERPKYLMGYYDPTLSRIMTHASVFGHLLNDRMPQLGTHLDALGIHPLMYLPAWFMCLFTTLPCWDTVLSACDLIFLEGVNTIFRVSLAIMEACSPELLAMHRLEVALPFLQHLPSRLVSHKRFCRTLWQTVVHGWEVELFQDLVLTGLENGNETKNLNLKRVSPGEWNGESENGTLEPARKRKKISHNGDATLSTGRAFISKLVSAITPARRTRPPPAKLTRPLTQDLTKSKTQSSSSSSITKQSDKGKTPSRLKAPSKFKTPIVNLRKGVSIKELEGQFHHSNGGRDRCTALVKGDIELMDFSSGVNKLFTDKFKEVTDFPMMSPLCHRESPASVFGSRSYLTTNGDTALSDRVTVSNGNQGSSVSPVIGHLRRSVRVAKRRSGVTKQANDGFPAPSIISPSSVRPLQEKIHGSRVYCEQKAFRTFATPTPLCNRHKRQGSLVSPPSDCSPTATLSLLSPEVELRDIVQSGATTGRARRREYELPKMSPLVSSPAVKVLPSSSATSQGPSLSRSRKRHRDEGGVV